MLQIMTRSEVNQYLSSRDGESKLGQTVKLISESAPSLADLKQALCEAKTNGVQFVIVGITEDAGPRANLGRGGSSAAFSATMQQWLNLQSNRYLDGKQCLILGEISQAPLPEAASLEELRQATKELDNQVISVISQIMAAELEPIVIGGGHNNAYGMLMATKAHFNQAAAAVNLDPHSDFRPREGRHSGNGFSYAAANGALAYYHVLGLHELKNTEATLEQLSLFGGHWHSFQQIWVRREIDLSQALQQIASNLNQTQLPVALEIDVDAIAKMPSSASTFAGVPLLDACHYIHHIAKHCPCAYLHIAEAAPQCHDAGDMAGKRDVGQSVCELMYSYIQARKVS
ncbi:MULTISPECIES: formimidoylglutamase [unclassified Shewanella]|uniref:formimidoylglutamase n=1 Tax=unclassified Shewanella TaxID=196818 RepID=UPI000C85D786|nr:MULTISPECIES: formimidoylglutamase [unclassified Shewanella]MDO6641270.1 formimidoylglutamase [Shewanella sp. 5_MG-2023]MDO6775368.1 formimidoylglutamase [Shewanella sp. 3_MG-2023]PMG30397.1 arginase [Shewanella sp. 10N.286.52.C2]PMG51465.1 arginase [Shewanella sp. 10N.286.52.B9]PMH87994.1 arginase [Shewanella sp. 10N.286.48.B5]